MLGGGAIALIGFYQRHLSPRTGWCCAYRIQTGKASCSRFARRAIGLVGLCRGLALLARRFAGCSASARALATAMATSRKDAADARDAEDREGAQVAPASTKESDPCTFLAVECCLLGCPWP
jgi:putative component of membrane protein insertase Oxa1/YidC/SpoIIIJ protein YidD